MPDDPQYETITRPSETEYTHSRLTHPFQFAKVKLRLEPLSEDVALEFVNGIENSAIPAAWIDGIKRGIQEAAPMGVLNGGPVVGCRVVLLGTAHHEVDSSAQAFCEAAREAFWRGMRAAGPKFVRPPP
jgi:elongation factor G